ncbi:hypothetical protein LTR04_004563, partial [Oleoguttula sp. CCFEE 6159]
MCTAGSEYLLGFIEPFMSISSVLGGLTHDASDQIGKESAILEPKVRLITRLADYGHIGSKKTTLMDERIG